jgi:hypothetical protein
MTAIICTRLAAPMLLLALTIGCTTPERKEPNVNLAGYPPAFQDGYMDGCNSARRPESPKKDEERYKQESQYAAGWRDGHDICSKQKK